MTFFSGFGFGGAAFFTFFLVGLAARSSGATSFKSDRTKSSRVFGWGLRRGLTLAICLGGFLTTRFFFFFFFFFFTTLGLGLGRIGTFSASGAGLRLTSGGSGIFLDLLRVFLGFLAAVFLGDFLGLARLGLGRSLAIVFSEIFTI